ncbi:MAG: hypothetical protein KAH23_00180 [Kiritimatiellae bacterium]|nr:hypothetical protein [Kiritimatiellia bacterium]
MHCLVGFGSFMRNFSKILIFGIVCLPVALLCADEGVRLPSSAVKAPDGTETGGWQMTGTISGVPAIAGSDFGLCLNRQGWRRQSRTVMSRGRRGSVLTVWVKGKKSLLLMLWESGAGKSRFSIGEYKRNDRNKRKKE